MKRNFRLFFCITLMLGGCTQKHIQKNKVLVMKDNPLLGEFNTPLSLPPFDKIGNHHYEEAFRVSMGEQRQEIRELIENSQEPSFANTIEALERSGALLSRTQKIFSNLKEANSDEEMRNLGEKMAPILAQHRDNIYLDSELFSRISAVYQQRSQLVLSEDQEKLLEDTYRNFIRRGAGLADDKRKRLKDLNQEITILSEKFGNNVLQETQNYELWIDNPKDLSGIPQDSKDDAAQEAIKRGAPGKWVFTTDRSSITPFLTFADDRLLRKQIFEAYTNRGKQNNQYNNHTNAAKMASLRAERAKLLGFETHAHYVLDDETAKTPERVNQLLTSIWPEASDAAKKDLKAMQDLAKSEGKTFTLSAWDWWYYAEKLRKKKYDFDESTLKEYFSLDSTRKGAFYVAEKLFGLSFKERFDLPKYHADVRTFEVHSSSGDLIGIYYADYFRRNGKQGGAWMNDFRAQERLYGKRIVPVIVNVLNLSKPAPNQPALLSIEEANTLFHEFGHALHGLLSDTTYASQSGTSVPRDFVEFPSQVYENWMLEEEVLNTFAKHYLSNKTIPSSLVRKIKAARRFNQGFQTVEYIAASYLDLAWHSLTSTELKDVNAFESQAMKRIGLIKEIAPRYRTGYFNHIFAGGYSAGYYSYLWSQVLDADTFALFKRKGIFNPETAQAYQELLSNGGSKEAMKLYKNFTGNAPNRGALVKRLGFNR